MRARSQDTPSAPRTETVPVLVARFSRGMRRPDGGTWAGPPHTPLLSVTASRKPYGLIARSVMADQLLPGRRARFAGEPRQPPPWETTAHAFG